MSDRHLQDYFDYTLLRPWVSDEAFQDFVKLAAEYSFRGVCVSPYIAGEVVQALKQFPNIRVGTVVSFPHGNVPLQFKLDQVHYFSEQGVQDIDWVLHYGEVTNDNWKQVAFEMESMANLCRSYSMISKCIVETCYVRHPKMLEQLYRIATAAGVDFIKTSTGFGQNGAEIAHVQLWDSIRKEQGTGPKIKASGGIKTFEQALDFIRAGADLLGVGEAVQIMEEAMQGATKNDSSISTETASQEASKVSRVPESEGKSY